MAKKQLTEDQYLAELNRQLKEDEDYENGMAFTASPPGATGKAMSGYHMTVPFKRYDWIPIYARVSQKVSENFQLLV